MFLDDLASILVGANVGTLGVNIFATSKAQIPVGDGPYLGMTETGGAGPEGTHNSTVLPAYQRPNAQILVRGKSYDAAKAMALQAYAAVFPIRNQLVNGVWWRSVSILQEPSDMGLDANGRATIVFNISVVKRPNIAMSIPDPSYGATVLSDGAIGLWKFNGDGVDSSVAGHPAIAEGGAPIWGTVGALSNGDTAVSFLGTGMHFEVADEPLYLLTEACTIEMFVFVPAAHAQGGLFNKTIGGHQNQSFQLMFSGDQWQWRCNGSFGQVQLNAAQTQIGRWVYLVATFDGTQLCLYIDGEQVGSVPAIGTLNTGAGNLYMGLLGDGFYSFTGSMQDVALYPLALTSAQVASHYALRLSTFP